MKVLFDEETIRAGVARIAAQIRDRFDGQDLTVLAVLRGGIVFAADLIRAMRMPVRLDTVGVSSYRGASTMPGEVRIISSPSLEVAGKPVLLVDDILDSGRTLARLREEVLARGASAVATAVLLDKPSRRVADIEPDFVAFTVPDVWVVGYGLDHGERHRNLPYIAALEAEEMN